MKIFHTTGFSTVSLGGLEYSIIRDMRLLALAIHKANQLFGVQGRPYRIWNKRWFEDGGIAWDFPSVNFTPSQIDELNAVFAKISQLMLPKVLAGIDDFEKAYQALFLQESQHLDQDLRQYGYQAAGFNQTQRKHERAFRHIRKLLSNTGVIAYKSQLCWQGVTATSFQRLVIAPFSDQFNILRTEETVGNNHFWTTQENITMLRSIDKKYGIHITGANYGALEFELKQVPEGKAAKRLGKLLLRLAPDIDEAPETYRERRVALWWD